MYGWNSTRQSGVLRGLLEPTFAFLIAIAFWPGIAGAATSPRWAIASLSLWFMEWYCLPFVAVCFLVLDFDAACHWAILSTALCWGFKAEEGQFRRAIIGFALGIGINSAVAIAQASGFNGIEQLVSPGGLFLNKNVMGEAACLAFIAALQFRLWPFALLCVPAALLSDCRAAWLGTLLGLLLLASWRQRIALLSVSLFGALLLWHLNIDVSTSSLMQRFGLWKDAVAHLTWFGNGSYDYSTLIHREPNLHNDWLQFIYELGIVGLIPIALVVYAAGTATAFVAALVAVASFGFPLHDPASAWLAVFVVGYALRLQHDESRNSVRARHDTTQLR